jgi:hypothetical protein
MRRAHASLVEAPSHQVRSSGSYGIAFTFARAINPIMVFHSVAVAGGLIVAIALAWRFIAAGQTTGIRSSTAGR